MDIPLDEQGLREAEETAQKLVQHPVACIYSSDLYRARQTAEAVARATLAPIVQTPDLRPWNLGTLAGQRVKDILPLLQQLEVYLARPRPEANPSFSFVTDIRGGSRNYSTSQPARRSALSP